MILNKEKMESLIDFYFEHVSENIVDAQDVDRNLLNAFHLRTTQSRALQRTAATSTIVVHDKKELEEENHSQTSFSFGSNSGIGKGVKHKPPIEMEELNKSKAEKD